MYYENNKLTNLGSLHVLLQDEYVGATVPATVTALLFTSTIQLKQKLKLTTTTGYYQKALVLSSLTLLTQGLC